MDTYYKQKIANEFVSCAKRTIERIQKRENSKESDTNPFQERLLPKEAIFWARFERSFSTSFGQRVIEKLSKYVALANSADSAENQKKIHYSLSQEELNSVSSHIDKLRSGNKIKPHWEKDLSNLCSVKGIRDIQIVSNFDLWFLRNGINHYISIKTVKPNIDQTSIAKQDMMKISLYDPKAVTYYGLYYNPFGEERNLYNHRPPFTIFNMLTDPCVLIGKDYWDTIGQEGTYEEILQIAEDVQEETLKLVNDYGRTSKESDKIE